MDLISLIGIVGATAGALIAIAKGVKIVRVYVIAPILNHFEAVHKCILDVGQIKKKLDYELNPNGGLSLKDQVQNFGKSLSRVEGVTLSILGSCDRGAWISDEKGSYIFANEWYNRKLGWDVNEMLGTGWKNTILENEREKVSREFSDSVKDGRAFIMDYTHIHKGDPNKIIRVHAVSHSIKRNSGEIIGFIGFTTEKQ